MVYTTLFCYVLKKLDSSTKTKLHRELYGYTDISNYGKYTYKRKGILEKIQHTKILNGVILIKQKDESKLIKIFKKYPIKFHVFHIK